VTLAQSAPVAKSVAADVEDDLVAETATSAPPTVHDSTELLESITGSSADAPL